MRLVRLMEAKKQYLKEHNSEELLRLCSRNRVLQDMIVLNADERVPECSERPIQIPVFHPDGTRYRDVNNQSPFYTVVISARSPKIREGSEKPESNSSGYKPNNPYSIRSPFVYSGLYERDDYGARQPLVSH